MFKKPRCGECEGKCPYQGSSIPKPKTSKVQILCLSSRSWCHKRILSNSRFWSPSWFSLTPPKSVGRQLPRRKQLVLSPLPLASNLWSPMTITHDLPEDALYSFAELEKLLIDPTIQVLTIVSYSPLVSDYYYKGAWIARVSLSLEYAQA